MTYERRCDVWIIKMIHFENTGKSGCCTFTLLWQYEAFKRHKTYLFLSKLCLIFAKYVCDYIEINAVHFDILKPSFFLHIYWFLYLLLFDLRWCTDSKANFYLSNALPLRDCLPNLNTFIHPRQGEGIINLKNHLRCVPPTNAAVDVAAEQRLFTKASGLSV